MYLISALFVNRLYYLIPVMNYVLLVEAYPVRKKSFTVAFNKAIVSNSNTIAKYSVSFLHCGAQCLQDGQCCSSSYNPAVSSCSLDASCTPVTISMNGVFVLSKKLTVSPACVGCINFGSSSYSVIDKPSTWETAGITCEDLGGELAEIESMAENIFLKNIFLGRVTPSYGYWLGGYNYNKDSTFEWRSDQSQPLPFADFDPTQPNNLLTELCLCSWKTFNFKWGNYDCSTLLQFICEFQEI